jgi:hypothetical protein
MAPSRAMSRTSNAPAGPTPQTLVSRFIRKFDPPIARSIRAARRLLRQQFPTAYELVYDNYNFFVIGYSPTTRAGDTIVSLAASSNGIALSFYHGADLPDPKRILLGSGKQNRFIRLPTPESLARPEVQAVIRAAVKNARSPLGGEGKRRTIISSVSAKQRSRRSKPAWFAELPEG